MSESTSGADAVCAGAGFPRTRLQKAEAYVEAEEGVVNRLFGWAGIAGHLDRGRDVAVSPLRRHRRRLAVHRFPDHHHPAAALRARRLRADAELPAVSAGGAVPQSHPLVGRRGRHRRRVAILVYAIEGGEEFTDRATIADAARRRARRDLHRAAARGDAAHHRLDRAGRRAAVHRLRISVRICRRPGRIAATTFGQLVGHLFITLEGIFGIPVDVSSSLIILFTIYGAFLQHSGAGKFFIDFSMALMGDKPNSAGRTVVLSSFLLGGPSGSGVATTVTIGAVAYPMMERAGFEKNAAGGLLAAGGLGAIISPPVLGAAAFLIAEFLKISYLDVIWMATIPTCLYYLSLLFMVELDAKRFGAAGRALDARNSRCGR